MTLLSVNVNKLATLRNSREKNLPDVTAMAEKILTYGAHGITIHPRPDGRHIRTRDVWEIRDLIAKWNAQGSKAEFNIEGYPSPDFIALIREAKPHQATLVPDPPEALTSNAGWDLVREETLLKKVIGEIRTPRTRISLFVEPDKYDAAQSAALARIKPERIELYTEAYSDAYPTSHREQVTENYARVARDAAKLGIGVNAGHDLNQRNLKYLITAIPNIEALEDGMERTIRAYLAIVGGQ
jgi:pyridoxine 5-phosphate synthase